MDTADGVRFCEEALRIPTGHRKLSSGETVDGQPLMGFPCRLFGSGVRIAMWHDGSETAAVPPGIVRTFRRMEALRLILSNVEVFSGAQIRLIRRELGITQQQLANELGVDRTTINHLEVSDRDSDKTKTKAVKYVGRFHVSRLAGMVEEHNRMLNRQFFERMQEALTVVSELPEVGNFHTDDVNLCRA